MTSTTFFPGASPSSSTGQRVAPRVHKAQATIQAPRAVISAVAAYPWMTQSMLAALSPRARRLLRADY